jgi:hypothetical protein
MTMVASFAPIMMAAQLIQSATVRESSLAPTSGYYEADKGKR